MRDLTCGHCGEQIAHKTRGFVGDTWLCHGSPVDCFKLVTVYGHRPDGSCCRQEESKTDD